MLMGKNQFVKQTRFRTRFQFKNISFVLYVKHLVLGKKRRDKGLTGQGLPWAIWGAQKMLQFISPEVLQLGEIHSKIMKLKSPEHGNPVLMILYIATFNFIHLKEFNMLDTVYEHHYTLYSK